MSENSESEQVDEVPSILDSIVKAKNGKGSVDKEDEEIVASRYFEQEHYEIMKMISEAEEPEHKKVDLMNKIKSKMRFLILKMMNTFKLDILLSQKARRKTWR